MASSSNPAGEPMYSVSQIQIPPELPEILKQFTKAAIKTQPSDIKLWACQYFEAVAKGKQPPAKTRVAAEPTLIVETPALTLAKLRMLKARIGQNDQIDQPELLNLCQEIEIPGQTVQDALAVGEFGPSVPVHAFLALQAAELKPELGETLRCLASVYNDDAAASTLPTSACSAAFGFLADLEGLDESARQPINDALAAAGEIVDVATLPLPNTSTAAESSPDLTIKGEQVDNETARGSDEDTISILDAQDQPAQDEQAATETAQPNNSGVLDAEPGTVAEGAGEPEAADKDATESQQNAAEHAETLSSAEDFVSAADTAPEQEDMSCSPVNEEAAVIATAADEEQSHDGTTSALPDTGSADASGGNSVDADTIAIILGIKESHPGNRMAKHFDVGYYSSLSENDKVDLLKVCKSGTDNPDSGMGCYAMQPADYDRFKPFFSKVLTDYHNVDAEATHTNNWDLSGVEGLPEDGKLDLEALGLPPLSMRVRVGRNLADFSLPGAMTKDDRINLEKKMCQAFDQLKAMPEYGGGYNSLTPDHPDHITDEQYQQLVKQHIMFKDMAADPYLASAGIASDWPYGRGCYVSEDRGFVIWVGEEDHLRIMCMKKGTLLNEVFDRLKTALDVVSSIDGLSFAMSPDYGVVTSCPTNLGTGMRASVHMPIPNLTADGTDAKAKAVCKPLGLSVRGIGGEHTPIGEGGVCDISPSARFCITETRIITALYTGIKLLKEQEDEHAVSKVE
eukprot:TRINITY_DN12361_c0_g1_i1.p1 TRINITY_DN12361_c0_g1~~TRINITY_DN12361_c0_g1_i1.p1  ORF type:complete len:740 (+),score=202.17 TRINITY_DN12361_c0_g1_i1:50-2269(+)